MPRTVGTLTPAWFSDPQVVRAYYVKFEFGGGTGTVRWTTKQTYPATVDARDIDGSVQSWDGTKDWNVGAITEGSQTEFSISDLIIANQANEFSDLIYLAGGIAGVPITVWCAGFQKAPPHAFIDKFVLFKGEGERCEFDDEARLSLVPLKHPMLMTFPRRRFDVAHGFKWIPKPGTKIEWGGRLYELPAPSVRQTHPDDPGPEPPEIPQGGRRPPILVPRDRRPRPQVAGGPERRRGGRTVER